MSAAELKEMETMSNLADNLKASQDQCGVYDPNAIRGIGEQKNNKPYYGDECNIMSPEPPSLRREAEDRVGFHRQQAEKADQAAAFFRENPAFDMFVRLVRQGVIQI
jgi:hypothetical protein